MMKFYFAPNTVSLAVRIALEEAGAPYTPVRIDFDATEQRSPAYLAVNPKGRVPTLVTDRGAITEAPAILAYIAQTFPAAALAPKDPFDFAEVQAFTMYLCATFHVAHAHRMRGHRWADDPAAIAAMQRKVPETVTACCDAIEHGMFRGPWVMGATYSIADPYLFTVISWIEKDGVDTTRLPKLMDHRRRMLERPAVQRALAGE